MRLNVLSSKYELQIYNLWSTILMTSKTSKVKRHHKSEEENTFFYISISLIFVVSLTLWERHVALPFNCVLMLTGRQRIHWSSRTSRRHWNRLSWSQGT